MIIALPNRSKTRLVTLTNSDGKFDNAARTKSFVETQKNWIPQSPADRYVFIANRRGEEFPESMKKHYLALAVKIDGLLPWGSAERILVSNNAKFVHDEEGFDVGAVTSRSPDSGNINTVFDNSISGTGSWRARAAEEMYHQADWTTGKLTNSSTDIEELESEIRAREWVLSHQDVILFTDDHANTIRETVRGLREDVQRLRNQAREN